MSYLHRCLFAFAIALAWTTPLHAQSASPEDRLRSALRETRRQLNETQDELATVRAELASVKQQLAAVPPPKACPRPPVISQQARVQLDRLSSENSELRKYVEESQKTMAKWQEAQTQWQAGLQQVTEQARAKEADASNLKAELDKVTGRERDCRTKNEELVKISSELLDRYRDKGIWELVRNAEPITQIHRVQLETLAQEYGDKIKDNQLVGSPKEKEVEHENQP